MPEQGRQAVLYLRLSRGHGHASESLESQEKALRHWAEREELPVRAVVNEGAGLSMYGDHDIKRPAWDLLIEDLEPGDIVAAVETSRFARNVEDGLRQFRRVRAAGADVVTLDGEDTRRTDSKLAMTVRLAVAEEESRVKSGRVKRAKQRLRESARWQGGPPPFGYDLRDGRLVQNPDTAPIVRRAITATMEGQSLVSLAKRFTREQVPTPKGGRGWWQTTALTVVRNPVNVGWYPTGKRGQYLTTPDGDPVIIVDGPPISTVSDWTTALACIASRVRPTKTGKRWSTGHPVLHELSGVLRCGRCLGPMHGASWGSKPHYRCTNRDHSINCTGLSVLARFVEPSVETAVFRYLAGLDPTDDEDKAIVYAVSANLPRPMPVSSASARLARERLAEIHKLRDDLREARYVRGEFAGPEGPREYERLVGLQENRAALQREILEADTGPTIGPLQELIDDPERWKQWSLTDRVALLRAVLDHVVLAPRKNKRDPWDPSRLTFAWRRR